MVSVEQLQAPCVDALQPEFEQALLAVGLDSIGQLPQKTRINIIGPGGENDAETVRLCKERVDLGEQLRLVRGGTGLLLKIPEIEVNSVSF